MRKERKRKMTDTKKTKDVGELADTRKETDIGGLGEKKGRGMKVRRDRKRRPLGLPVGLLLGAGLLFTACAGREMEPVVAERTAPAEENRNAVGENRNAVEENRGAAEENRNAAAGDTDTASDTPGSSAGEAQKLAARLEIPERYVTRAEGERVLLTADADVWVPDRETMPECEVKRESYKEADYRAFQRLTAEAAGVTWKEDEKGSSIRCNSEDEKYEISFVDGSVYGTTPILWMRHRSIADGSSSYFDSRDISGLDLTEEEKSRIETMITAKAEECLEGLQSGDFALKSRQWRALQEHKEDSGGIQPTGTYGIRLHYVREYQGTPVASTTQGLMGQPSPAGQYVSFLYDSEGTLLRMQVTDRIITDVEERDSRFLLLFDTAVQIFEQYCKTYFQEEGHWNSLFAQLYGEGDGTASSVNVGDKAVEVSVSSVRLEYRVQPEEGEPSESFSRGSLIPVWNFYGTAAGSQESLLVSINAEDGTIYGD